MKRVEEDDGFFFTLPLNQSIIFSIFRIANEDLFFPNSDEPLFNNILWIFIDE